MVSTIHRQETPEQAIARLAQKARDEGVKLYRDPKDGRYYASSVSEPGRLHYLTGVSCDCLGFIRFGRCKHHAALMVALGWNGGPPNPDPEPISPLQGTIIRCPDCNGLGEVQCSVSAGRSFRYDWTVCSACHGRGEIDRAAA